MAHCGWAIAAKRRGRELRQRKDRFDGFVNHTYACVDKSPVPKKEWRTEANLERVEQRYGAAAPYTRKQLLKQGWKLTPTYYEQMKMENRLDAVCWKREVKHYVMELLRSWHGRSKRSHGEYQWKAEACRLGIFFDICAEYAAWNKKLPDMTEVEPEFNRTEWDESWCRVPREWVKDSNGKTVMTGGGLSFTLGQREE